ncbi:MAG: sulfatase-like hydrolase/transferase [Candidatus Poribacteria bacterium]|nr:sulfatase-like hydrolase/transferase [Candidatus Poribacteria bacterium]
MKNKKLNNVFSQPISRREFLSTSLKVGAAASFTSGLLPNLSAETKGQYNVLFIIGDDLRPFLGCYGHEEVITPNIDKIAEKGTQFNRAYCQYPLCSPSRISMMSGLRPETTQIINNRTELRDTVPNAITLPQHFKSNGYHTQSLGRVHTLPRLQDDEYSWSVPSWRPTYIPYDISETPSWRTLDVDDDELEDGKIAKRAINVLNDIKNQPFFLTLGFFQPHLPHKIPIQYYELYDGISLNLPVSTQPPENAPARSINNWNAIRAYQDLPEGRVPLTDEKTLELIRAYAASTTYMDAQIGRVLAQLDVLGLTDNTVIVFCGDHGYHLGDHGMWGKQTLFDVSLHSPLIISIPGQLPTVTNSLCELIDIYPTVCHACDLPIPRENEGSSMLPIIDQQLNSWKPAVFSRFGGPVYGGRSIRTDQYRYTERGENGRYGIELYDYMNDPDETVNIANLPENNDLVAELSEQLHAGWQNALPDTHEQTLMTRPLRWDINNDGIVDIQDLLIISSSIGDTEPENPKVDVNYDGKVNIIDLLIVAAHIGESTIQSAPPRSIMLSRKHIEKVDKWLSEAYQLDDGSAVFRDGIANLEALMKNIIPEKTVLLPNYPNPFNPETWIPYDLAQDSHVNISIYNIQGETVKHINLGYQNAGTYRTKSHAAYWDGRNTNGEPVSSGVYFYSLNTGKTKTIRQMVILK